jgi:hypothetical protein
MESARMTRLLRLRGAMLAQDDGFWGFWRSLAEGVRVGLDFLAWSKINLVAIFCARLPLPLR